MSTDTIIVAIKGPKAAKGTVSIDSFCEFLESVQSCLRRAESKFPDVPKLTYQIVGLKQSSAVAELKPLHQYQDTPDGGKVLRLFEEVTESIQSGRQIDARFTTSDLLPFKKLAMPLRNGVREIRIAKTNLSSDYLANLEKVLGSVRTSIGSVRGKIEKLNVHNRNEFTLFPLIGNRIQCRFPESLYGDVLAAVRKNATIHGRVSYLPGHDFPETAEVTEIEVHPPDDELPRFSEMRGRGKGRLRGKKSSEYTRTSRGD